MTAARSNSSNAASSTSPSTPREWSVPSVIAVACSPKPWVAQSRARSSAASHARAILVSSSGVSRLRLRSGLCRRCSFFDLLVSTSSVSHRAQRGAIGSSRVIATLGQGGFRLGPTTDHPWRNLGSAEPRKRDQPRPARRWVPWITPAPGNRGAQSSMEVHGAQSATIKGGPPKRVALDQAGVLVRPPASSASGSSPGCPSVRRRAASANPC